MFLIWFPPLFPCLVSFPGSLFRSVHPLSGPSSHRFEVSFNLNFGAKAFACETPWNKTFFAPSRCCCVQMVRSYQACLTSASVNTTRCLVDVLISAWSKKKVYFLQGRGSSGSWFQPPVCILHHSEAEVALPLCKLPLKLLPPWRPL